MKHVSSPPANQSGRTGHGAEVREVVPRVWDALPQSNECRICGGGRTEIIKIGWFWE